MNINKVAKANIISIVTKIQILEKKFGKMAVYSSVIIKII